MLERSEGLLVDADPRCTRDDRFRNLFQPLHLSCLRAPLPGHFFALTLRSTWRPLRPPSSTTGHRIARHASCRSRCCCSTSSRSRRRRRCGTRANTSRPRTRSASRIRRAIRSSCSSAACSRSCRSRRRVAVRINMLAAICSAVSAGMWFLITERVLVSWFPERWQRIARRRARGAHRRDGVHGVEPVGRQREGVHGLAGRHRDHLVADGALVRRSRRPQGRRILVLIAYLLGLGYANHMAGMLAAPAVGLAVLDPPSAHAPPLAAAARVRGRAAPRHDAVRDAADSRRAFPGDQRRRADGVPHGARVRRARSARARATPSSTTSIASSTASRELAERRRRSPRRSGCGGCTSSGSGCATRTASSRRCRRCSPRCSSCSGCFGGWVH